MKKKILSLFMVMAITIFQLSPTMVSAGSIGVVGVGKRVTFTETDTSSEEVLSTTNMSEFIDSKKDEFIEAMAAQNVTVNLSHSNIDPNTLFSETSPYKYATVDNIVENYMMIEGNLTQVYTVEYTTVNVTTSHIIRATTTNYHTRVIGTLSITGDDTYSKNYNSGEDYIGGNYTDENIVTIINNYKDDMSSIADDYHRSTFSTSGGITEYYYEAHDEITQSADCPTNVANIDYNEYPNCIITINTILDKYQIYKLVGRATTKKITYTLSDERGNQISFKDYSGIVFVFNSTDILNITDEELQVIADEMEMDLDEVKAMGTESIDNAKNAVKGKGTLVGLYDFSISDGNSLKEQATGGFKIRIKMTEEMKKFNDFKIAYLKNDGTLDKLIKLTQNGDYLEGVLPHLSNYAVVGNLVEVDSIDNPKTGDNITLYISVLGLSIIGLVGTYTRKRRFN